MWRTVITWFPIFFFLGNTCNVVNMTWFFLYLYGKQYLAFFFFFFFLTIIYMIVQSNLPVGVIQEEIERQKKKKKNCLLKAGDPLIQIHNMHVVFSFQDPK